MQKRRGKRREKGEKRRREKKSRKKGEKKGEKRREKKARKRREKKSRKKANVQKTVGRRRETCVTGVDRMCREEVACRLARLPNKLNSAEEQWMDFEDIIRGTA